MKDSEGNKICGIWNEGEMQTELYNSSAKKAEEEADEVIRDTAALLSEAMRIKGRSNTEIELQLESSPGLEEKVVRLGTVPSKVRHIIQRSKKRHPTNYRTGIDEEERTNGLSSVADVFSHVGSDYSEEALKLLKDLPPFEYKPNDPQHVVPGYTQLDQMDAGWYKGELARAGVREGRGALVNDKYIYQGHWLNSKRHGYGRLMTKIGSLYEGFFKNDKREGFGVYTTLLGLSYIGDWHHDEFHGIGKLKTPLGTYEGPFLNGGFEGKGELRFADGSVYKGSFASGLMHGYGVYKRDEWCYNARWYEGSATTKGVTLHQSLMPREVPELSISETVEFYFYQEFPEFDKLYPHLRAYKQRLEKMIEKSLQSLQRKVAEDELDAAIHLHVLDEFEEADFYNMEGDIEEGVIVVFDD
mmetsp:Transcript_7378/g.13721  ORF Transcript_7378/g.13721 Transcript_7378/m.13721 type:complete len:414 (-) Transcript_7378:1442-2683(-)